MTDFGIARAATNNTISTAVMGSVHYTSPEQARGGYSDAKSDIYSLGITLYEMLTGHVPFDGESTVAIAIKHLQEEMKSPEIYVADLPRSTVQIIYKCTQKSPDRRYANMSELIRDLKESLVNPDGDFVQIASNAGGRTVVISKEELGAIKDGYNSARASQENIYHTVNPAENGAPGSEEFGQEYQSGYDPYTYGVDSRMYGNRGYDYQGENFDKNRTYQYDEEDEDGILNPKLEKIMTVGSVIIAVLIAAIFLGLIANALGIFKFSLPGLFTQKTTKTTEVQAGTKTTGSSADSSTGEVQQNNGTGAVSQDQTDAETTVTEEQTETTASTTEAETESPIQIEGGSTTVPDVTGMDYDTAYDQLMQAGFYVSRQDDASDTVAAGTVISQSMTGNATPGSTVILIVSSGPDDGSSSAGTWMCNAQLEAPSNYNGEAVRLVLEQNGNQTVLSEGTAITFPYDLYVQGAANVSTGRVYLYVYDDAAGDYVLLVTYDNIPFSQVN